MPLYLDQKTGRAVTGRVRHLTLAGLGRILVGILSLVMLNGVGYVANQVQTPEALHGLVKLMSIFPAVFGILAILILVLFYPLNEAKMDQIANDLKARRAALGESPASVGA